MLNPQQIMNNQLPFEIMEENQNKRVKFTPEEDNQLARLISLNGAKKWRNIASKMPGRTARQCRDRYNNYLMPNLANSRWTSEEDALLISKYMEFGPRWSYIKEFFKNRSPNNIKNRWHVHLSKIYNRSMHEKEADVKIEREDSSSSNEKAGYHRFPSLANLIGLPSYPITSPKLVDLLA